MREQFGREGANKKGYPRANSRVADKTNTPPSNLGKGKKARYAFEVALRAAHFFLKPKSITKLR